MRQTQSPAVYRRERKYRRFNLQLPVSLSFRSAGAVRELMSVTKNVSIGGLLLESSDWIPRRTSVSLTIHVRGPWSSRPVRLLGEGKVVRVEEMGPGTGFAIAVECKQPMTEMNEYFSAAS